MIIEFHHRLHSDIGSICPYSRYFQHFDPGFCVCSVPFGLQVRNAPVFNYSTEILQLGCPRRPLPARLPLQQQMRASSSDRWVYKLDMLQFSIIMQRCLTLDALGDHCQHIFLSSNTCM